MEQPPVTTPDPVALPTAEQLSAAEFRTHREAQTPIAEIVKARTAKPVVEPPIETPDAIARDEQGRFVAKPAEPAADPVKPGKAPADNPRYNPNAKIDELTKHWRTAERERDELKAKLDALERPAPPAPKADPPKVEEPAAFTYAEYDPDKHGTYETYLDGRYRALLKHERAQELQAQQGEATKKVQDAQSARAAELKAQFDARQTEFLKSHPDFNDVVKGSALATVVPPAWFWDTLWESDHGPLLQYHFLQHPDAYHAIVALPSERAAVAAIVRLEASLTAAKTGPAAMTPVQTQADAPLEPVGASPTAFTPRNLDAAAKSDSNRDYRRLRESGMRA